jgi:hypothetical protein
VDFMPYEGGPLKTGRERERSILALSLGAVILLGAWVLSDVAPRASSSGQARLGDEGTGQSRSELAKRPAAAPSALQQAREGSPPAVQHKH